MKNLLYLVSLFLSFNVFAFAEIITLSDGLSVPPGAASSYTVPEDHTATLTAHALSGTAELRITDAADEFITRLGPDSLQGSVTFPAGVSVRAYADSSSTAFAQLTVSEISSGSAYIPQNTVVIPTDAEGPVQIILESSTDLLTWSPTSPGTYSTGTAQRFFRVRAVVVSP